MKIKDVERLLASHADLAHTLRGLLDVAPAFRTKPIGSPNSEARLQQDAHIAAEDEAKAALSDAKTIRAALERPLQ